VTTDNKQQDSNIGTMSKQYREKESSKYQIVLEKSLDELESIQMEDEVVKVLVTIIN
jgi:hypothetical protein